VSKSDMAMGSADPLRQSKEGRSGGGDDITG
jgi:hypothetical protein